MKILNCFSLQGYNEAATESFKLVNEDYCANIIEQAFKDIDDLVKDKNYKEIEKTFRSCESFNPKDIGQSLNLLYSTLASPICVVIQNEG